MRPDHDEIGFQIRSEPCDLSRRRPGGDVNHEPSTRILRPRPLEKVREHVGVQATRLLLE
jgi:hypothetical protein